MKERPILFSGPMIRAILHGTKTQTRRVVRWPILSGSDGNKRRVFTESDAIEVNALLAARQRSPLRRVACPYGQAGDRLWVREAWRPVERASDCVDGVEFRADGAFVPIDNTPEAAERWADIYHDRIGKADRWRPSIFMPRWASRITLAVEAVRVERLQEITVEDAMAEGIPQTAGEAHALGMIDMSRTPGHEWDNRTGVENFAAGWDSINGKRPGCAWADNPWVWAITFWRIDSEAGEGEANAE